MPGIEVSTNFVFAMLTVLRIHRMIASKEMSCRTSLVVQEYENEHENHWRRISTIRNVDGRNYQTVMPFGSAFVFGWDIRLPGSLSTVFER